MPTTTSRLALPAPTLSDPADVPADMLALANSVDGKILVTMAGTLAARPAAGTAGRIYRVSSGAGLSDLYYDNGTTWNLIWRPAPVLHALTLNSVWSVFDGAIVPSYSDPQPNGEVILSGLASWGSAGSPFVQNSNAGPMFTIPVGSRPGRQCSFNVSIGNSANGTYGTGIMECLIDGTCHLRAGILYQHGVVNAVTSWAATFVWLDSVRFFHTYS